MDLNKYVLEKALESRICEPWADKIAVAAGVDELMKMYVAGIDFCLKNNFPSNQDLINLGGDIINAYGVYVDDVKKLQDRDMLVSLGASQINLVISGFNVSQVYAKHNSQIDLLAIDNAIVMVDSFDDSQINVLARGNARVMINVYRGASVDWKTSGSGIVKVINKNKLTY